MKIKIINDYIVLYLINEYYDFQDKNSLITKVKELFVKLIKYYKYSFSGLYNVYIYDNKKYGSIIEIKKKKDIIFINDLIDVDVKIFKDYDFYFKTHDYFILKDLKNIYYNNNYYYVSIDNIDNICKYIEYGEIIYNEKDIKNFKIL